MSGILIIMKNKMFNKWTFCANKVGLEKLEPLAIEDIKNIDFLKKVKRNLAKMILILNQGWKRWHFKLDLMNWIH
jgi:hypothetical protein